jgi:actin-related protein
VKNITQKMKLIGGFGSDWFFQVHEARAIEHKAMKMPFGGRDLTDYFIKLVQKDGLVLTTTQRAIAQKMKETLCNLLLRFLPVSKFQNVFM